MVNLSSTQKTTDLASVLELPGLWRETLGDRRICVAVLDGPVDTSHSAFAGADLTQIDTLASGVASHGAALEHGTHIASVLFGQHDSPVKGVVPKCRGLIVPVFRDGGSGTVVPCSQVDLARALSQAIQFAEKENALALVVNISGGQFSSSGTAHPLLADVISKLVRSDVLIVAAAGNQGCECLHIPAALPTVLSVGAMDESGNPLEFSNWGEAYRSQGVLAPGIDVLGAIPGGGVRAETGTSYACAVVSGVVALLMSMHLNREGTRPSAVRVREAILETAIKCAEQVTADCRRFLAGRMDLSAAKNLLFSPGEHSMTENIPASASDEPQAETSHLPNAVPVQSIAESGHAVAGSTQVPSDCSASPGLAPSGAGPGCGCGGMQGPPQLVYAIGQLGFDFGTEARRDSFIQAMQQPASPYDARQLLAHLEQNPWAAASLIWTLSIDATPVYAVVPAGPFAPDVHERLRQFLKEQMTSGVERVSVPGIINGAVRLANGEVVPAIVPEIRGMYSWTTSELIKACCGPEPKEKPQKEDYQHKVGDIHNFLDRVYYELRNLGMTPQERAINFAATNAFNIAKVYEEAVNEHMDLDLIEKPERSPICRPESDCWDVKLMFFYPERQVQTVRKAHRFTVDVSDVVPVTVGPVRSWFVR